MIKNQNIVITKDFDRSIIIGKAVLAPDIKINHDSIFGVGGIIKEKVGNMITKFDLKEISLLTKPDFPDLRPKGFNAKHFKLWMRKGKCPGCGVGCGSKHQDKCWAREKLLSQIEKK